ncbi:MAG TPA: OsmC family protein [Polyangia bacterium]|nr:OsmC family protein [Polyangia bacterium]
MSQHKATVSWKADNEHFLQGKFTRQHTWVFDGGVMVAASASPAVVPAPYSNAAAVDPEEAYVASVSSCHMLTFLWEARKAGFRIESYEDDAVGEMTKNERGVPWISKIVLHPRIVYGGDKRPSASDEAELHHKAHEGCFIAQSVKTEITVG